METILEAAIANHANDIYLLPISETHYSVKFHIDGRATQHVTLTTVAAQQMIAAVKYRAKMNISERRRPQLGRFSHKDIWIRVSTVGDFLNRETLVLRLIYQKGQRQNWLAATQFEQLYQHMPSAGLFLIAGLTGSGKTTTLYRLLERLAEDKLVLTIEDPVEIQQSKFVQLQVNDDAGIHYDDLIKVALRHRPEILLVGEIRDQLTAAAVVRAALSGHLVLSTIHAMSARDVILRLRDLGVEPAQLAVALTDVVYQRLVTTTQQQQAAIIDHLGSDDIARVLQGQTVPKFSSQWQEVLAHALATNKISKAHCQHFTQL